jgi:hypothetical protein
MHDTDVSTTDGDDEDGAVHDPLSTVPYMVPYMIQYTVHDAQPTIKSRVHPQPC